MPCEYISLTGIKRTIDLDSVIDVALGYSAKRDKWTATLVFDPGSKVFVELRSSPQDVRGNSADEAEEVDVEYMANTFGLKLDQLSSISERPSHWRLIDLR